MEEEDGKKDWKEEVRQNEFLNEKTKLLRDDLLHPFSRRYERNGGNENNALGMDDHLWIIYRVVFSWSLQPFQCL